MGFLDRLGAGEPGAHARFAADLERVAEADSAALLRDPERRVAWEIAFAPYRLDLDDATSALLRDDVEAEARAAFEATWAELGAEPDAAERPPCRTSDAAWSPVILVEKTSLGDASALRVIHRMSYQPAHEMVIGRVLVPLSAGVLSIAATSLTRSTGYREAMRLNAALASRAGASPAEVARELGQAGYDDADYDLLFPDHPLTLVRAALAWLVDDEGGALAVTAPAPASPAGEITLPGPRCATTPPPRYLANPAGEGPKPLAGLTRMGLAVTSPRLLDVWRLDDAPILGVERDRQLLRVARKNAEEWAGESGSGAKAGASRLPSEGGRVHVQSHVRFVSGGAPMQAAVRWMADSDGTVFRVAASGGPWIPKEALFADAEATLQSLRRLDPSPPLDAAPETIRVEEGKKPKRGWWPFS